jgi:hypothetical protein
MELPDELWSYILHFALDWKILHRSKHQKNLPKIDGLFGPIVKYCHDFPPPISEEVFYSGNLHTTVTEEPLTIIEHHQKKCSNYAQQWQPVFATGYYGWAKLKDGPYKNI